MTKYFTKEGDEYKEVDHDLYTPEAMTDTINKRLERQRRNDFGDYDTLKEKASKVDSIASEFETKLQEKDVAIGDLTGKLKAAELTTEKVKIVSKYKLSDDAAEFLTGETAEELEAKAEKLAKLAPGSKVTITKQGKPGEGDDSKNDSHKIAGNLFGRKNSDA